MEKDRCAANGKWENEGGSSRQIEALEIRLVKAQANAERLRRGGPHESYLDAYFLVEALELQLQQAITARLLAPTE